MDFVTQISGCVSNIKSIFITLKGICHLINSPCRAVVAIHRQAQSSQPFCTTLLANSQWGMPIFIAPFLRVGVSIRVVYIAASLSIVSLHDRGSFTGGPGYGAATLYSKAIMWIPEKRGVMWVLAEGSEWSMRVIQHSPVDEVPWNRNMNHMRLKEN